MVKGRRNVRKNVTIIWGLITSKRVKNKRCGSAGVQ